MILQDRKRLARLMAIQDVSQRELARAAGWKAHSYLGRLLKGEVKTLEPEPALRIANYLQVAVDDLFLVKVDSNPGKHAQERKKQAA
ncbi:helix-turn-helix domain-containing protein [Rhodococcus pyridinivorans]|uniref:helix-turn-helix domain-containing protein n=1 Tax=Rhodococcus pyridinivorans TaxID=103816 RepID=UPI00200CD788|nr:helix-turn-helix transcriptional regulator [Rhodococcus pyridinivorans]